MPKIKRILRVSLSVSAGLILVFCWERIYLVDLRGKWDQVVVRRDELRRETELLRVRLATTTSRELIETKASELCGLTYPTEGQLVFIEDKTFPSAPLARNIANTESYVVIDRRIDGLPSVSERDFHGVKANEKEKSGP